MSNESEEVKFKVILTPEERQAVGYAVLKSIKELTDGDLHAKDLKQRLESAYKSINSAEFDI